jgi:hypothetical protein
MKNYYRFDRIAQTLASPAPGAGGAMLCEGVVARPGIYLYMNADGTTRRELVPRETLSDARTDGSAGVLTLARAPITLLHPPEMVTADNAAKYVVGDLDGEVVVSDSGYLRVRMAVRTQEALDALADGIAELSPGYWVQVDDTPGEDPEFGKYDAKQVGRVYNHVAIVPAARGGAECRVGLDAADPSAAVSEIITVQDETPDPPAGESAPDAPTEDPPVTDGSKSTSTSQRTSEETVLPDGTRQYTSEETYVTKTEVTPEPEGEESEELPEGWSMDTLRTVVRMLRKEMYGDAAPPPVPAPAVTAPVADDFVARYRLRRDLEDRAACTDVSKTDGDLARIALARWSVSTDGIPDAEAIQKALALSTTSATVTDAKPPGPPTADKPAACYTRPSPRK